MTTTINANTTAEAGSSPRLLSIDALRGFDMFWIVGGDSLAIAVLERFKTPGMSALKDQFEHVAWEGFRFYDLIFPLFLFLVGCVLPFSLEKYRHDPGSVYWRIARRVLVLFVLGVICNGLFKLDWSNLRIAGVLQRIAVCYGVAAILLLHLRPRGLAIAFAAILLIYWAILAWIPVPGGTAGDLSPEGNLAGYLDRTFLPGKIMPEYYGFGDNEGLLSTIPAIATVLLGCLIGQWLRSARLPWTKSGGLLIAGSVCLAIGYGWSFEFPIIKNLWTSSFVLVAGGWSILLLCLFYTLIDVLQFRRWAFMWVVIGVNAITIYVVPRIVDFTKISEFFLEGVAKFAADWGEVILIAGVLTAQWLFLYYLYRRRLFLRV